MGDQLVQLQVRRDLAADWTTNNPVLIEGEIGWETDTGWHKIGDGSTAWTALAYYHGPPWIEGIDGGGPASTYPGEPTGVFFGVMGTAPP